LVEAVAVVLLVHRLVALVVAADQQETVVHQLEVLQILVAAAVQAVLSTIAVLFFLQEVLAVQAV
jgi:hypothetical protein